MDINALFAALTAAQQGVDESDPFKPMADTADQLGQLVIKESGQSGANLKDSILSGLVTGLVGGFSENLGNSYKAKQNALSQDVLANAIAGRGFERPNGMSPSVFSTLDNAGSLFSAQRSLDLQDKNIAAKDDQQKVLLNALAQANTPQAQQRIIETAKALDVVPKNFDIGLGAAAPAPTSPMVKSLFPGAGKSMGEKFKDIQLDQLNMGINPSAATEAASKMTEAERLALKGSVDTVAEARSKANSLNDLASTAEAGMAGAGETGGLMAGPRNLWSKIQATFGDPEDIQIQASRTLLDSVKPDIIKATRTAGVGAMSDAEMKSYLASGPSTLNTPEGNALLIDKLRNVASLQKEYADFLETYRADQGTTQGAERYWAQYKAANPLFIQQGAELVANKNRPSWQDFFMGGQGTTPATPALTKGAVQMPQAGSAIPAGAQPTGETSNGKPVYMVNGRKWVSD